MALTFGKMALTFGKKALTVWEKGVVFLEKGVDFLEKGVDFLEKVTLLISVSHNELNIYLLRFRDFRATKGQNRPSHK